MEALTIAEFELYLKYLELRGFDATKRLALLVAREYTIQDASELMFPIIKGDLKERGLYFE